jgi:hypothetical protein
MQRDEWKLRLRNLMKDCQDEISKVTVIGKKMISASHTNSSLHETYEELGRLAAKHLKAGILEWENPRVNELLEQIEKCEKDLQLIEKEVKDIKVNQQDRN